MRGTPWAGGEAVPVRGTPWAAPSVGQAWAVPGHGDAVRLHSGDVAGACARGPGVLSRAGVLSVRGDTRPAAERGVAALVVAGAGRRRRCRASPFFDRHRYGQYNDSVLNVVKDQEPKRRYQSRLREDGTRRTRQAIVAAAGELFVANGYVATSLADIAVAAGVARPTVFAAFGSKPALLREVLDQALAGDDAPVPVADRPWFKPVWDATTQAAVLDAYAQVCVLIGGRAAALFETVRRAADAAPEVTELWDTLQANRRAGARMVVERLRSTGPLRPGLDGERAVDVMWLLNDPAHYSAMVQRCDWPADSFRDWLAGVMRDALLPR
ncbi:putative transcriptional regulator, TetR family [Streptosporangium roseum DSM 43021]|uniref:Transcriptional regulator, TetR family n=1 Tax=Streptosporangium roseum (strain ATCC 12428 / DSM 43021 / JCM 3005 / KCTC 9067 / NCIMB 10171 / NRRL 2505 / NI 9100) TaxID=479432 RepID=D2B4W9_STRRD|nr:putative transcriptional regulator, TetR family [Streptosporangium roseum DSM 43021]